MTRAIPDAVRALGLLPMAAGKSRESDLLDRYEVIQEFRRGSKQFGAQRQASEKRRMEFTGAISGSLPIEPETRRENLA